MVYIIVKGREQERARLKGKTVVEFSKNLESEGWPTEFGSEEERDKLAFEEKRRGRAIKKVEVKPDYRPEKVRKLQEADRQGEIREMTKKERAEMFGYIKY